MRHLILTLSLILGLATSVSADEIKEYLCESWKVEIENDFSFLMKYLEKTKPFSLMVDDKLAIYFTDTFRNKTKASYIGFHNEIINIYASISPKYGSTSIYFLQQINNKAILKHRYFDHTGSSTTDCVLR
tara:strand:+ start:1012 stop:1401 length:390 start_codon:yes stop_codon:yes gene_type:complete